ncbi:MAG: hypothetical protein KC619_22600 [Myxococcales bacterium]|nr:hypothetical protein [Myxococcales bacterium]
MLHDLYDSLQRRQRPEDVAEKILGLLDGSLLSRDREVLERAARGSLARMVFGYSSMLQDFARPIGMKVQVDKARILFASAYELTLEEASDPSRVEAFLRHVSPEIRKAFGASDFKADRLNRAARRAEGLSKVSRRRYNRMFRHLARMERKLEKLIRELRKYEHLRVGKSGLATRLSWEDFSASPNSAAFVAYYAARASRRSVFTVAGQDRPFDEIAEMLLDRCFADDHASFFAIAHVLPRRDVLERLDDAQKLRLMRAWSGLLHEIAESLRLVWERSDIARDTMIVRRGNDSSTWNSTASAWNQARQHWFALLYDLGLEHVLETTCPGKVLRLMAADVAAWHRAVGGSVDPDTLVWAELPLPWQVLSGEVACGRADVDRACRRHGVDPYRKGWIAPRPPGRAVEFHPTPELVHGVAVSDPALATALRKKGFFSGKKARGPTHEGDAYLHALVLGVHRSDEERKRVAQETAPH